MKIKVCSFGFSSDQDVLDYIDSAREAKKFVFRFSLRELPEPLTESNGKIYQTGESEEVKNFFVNGAGRTMMGFLRENEILLQGILRQISEKSLSEEAEFYYGCDGGIQRSVFAAKMIYERLRETYPEHKITKEHKSSYMREKLLSGI